jgi:hypothetical protein
MKSFTTGQMIPSNLRGAAAVKRIYHVNKGVFGVLCRNMNGNVVVMEALLENHAIRQIDLYWLELEPSYREKARLQGRLHDRDDMSIFDLQAYGHDIHIYDQGRRATLIMNQLKQYPIRILVHKGIPHAYVNDKRLRYIHVNDTVNSVGWPIVTSVDIHVKSKGKKHIIRHQC